MTLKAGDRIGHYQVIGTLGAGGMGEVYRARDTALGREVAIKVLPAALSNDPGRIQRFDREARVLASLTHPHIGQIYALERVALPSSSATATAAAAGSSAALVLELVEGVTLADRLANGPLPLEEALRISRQVADALEAAHDKGIVHRDLKPANIKIASDGFVKVLDFGLAKLISTDGDTPAGDQTGEGVVVGTAAYMSPEQARGQAVDKRTDSWAFGCLLFEMLTGRRAFEGRTASDTIAAVLSREPDWKLLPASTPASIRRLLVRCLDKDPRRRLREVGDSQLDIEEALGESGPELQAALGNVAAPRPATRIPYLAVGLAVVLVGVLAWLFWPAASAPPPRVSTLTTYRGSESAPSFSPDGTQVAFSWDGESRDNHDIYVLRLGDETPLQLTTDSGIDQFPVWSPDGNRIAFVRREPDLETIYTIPPLGGAERRLADFQPAVPETPGQQCPGCSPPMLAWTPDGAWLFVTRVRTPEGPGVFAVAADGSEIRRVVPTETAVHSPAVSSSGDALSFVQRNFVMVADIGPDLALDGEPRRLPTEQGSKLGTAWSPDDSAVIYAGGQVGYNPAYLWRVPASGGGEPVRLDLMGIGSFPSVAGNRLVYTRRHFDQNIWALREDQPAETILASTLSDYEGQYSPDGSRIAFATDRTGTGSQIWTANADGSNLASLTRGQYSPEGGASWSPDGRYLAFDGDGSDGLKHVYVVDEAGGPVRQIGEDGFVARIPSWSRDGLWIYFSSNRTGRPEIWRAPVAGGPEQQVSRNGGGNAMESWDGRTLYVRRAGRIYAMPVEGGPERDVSSVVYWNFWPSERGLYYVPTPSESQAPFTYDVHLLDEASGRDRVVRTFQSDSIGPKMSVSPDGETVLVSGAAIIDLNLMLVEDFQ